MWFTSVKDYASINPWKFGSIHTNCILKPEIINREYGCTPWEGSETRELADFLPLSKLEKNQKA